MRIHASIRAALMFYGITIFFALRTEVCPQKFSGQTPRK
jgi:hypothetical protein